MTLNRENDTFSLLFGVFISSLENMELCQLSKSWTLEAEDFSTLKSSDSYRFSFLFLAALSCPSRSCVSAVVRSSPLQFSSTKSLFPNITTPNTPWNSLLLSLCWLAWDRPRPSCRRHSPRLAWGEEETKRYGEGGDRLEVFPRCGTFLPGKTCNLVNWEGTWNLVNWEGIEQVLTCSHCLVYLVDANICFLRRPVLWFWRMRCCSL